MNVVINKMMDAEPALAFNVNKIPLANQPRLTDTTKLFIMGERPNCSNMFYAALEKWLDNNSKVFWLLPRGSTSGDAAFFMARHWCCRAKLEHAWQLAAVFEWVCLCIGLSFCLSGFVGYRSLAPCCMMLSLIATQKQRQFSDIQRWQNEAQQVARFIRKNSLDEDINLFLEVLFADSCLCIA